MNRQIRKRIWLTPLAVVPALCLSVGCAQLNDPFKDSAEYTREDMTTPSATANVSMRHESPPMAARSWNSADVQYENGTVTHWPLWFEDPFEDKGNDVTNPADRDAPDNRFAWNAADYLHIAYGPARFLVDLFGLPASAVAQPPGWLMASDGRLNKDLIGYNHDSTYAKATDEPPDFNNLSRSHYRRAESTERPEQTPP